jgi:hypothetical protein
MATTSRQTAIFGLEDWKKIYQTYSQADLQSYDFETLRKTFIDYLRLYYPETFNDYIESSEFIALLDVMAFMGQALAFRNDLNTRENFIDTAERRDSVVRLANLIDYSPKRNETGEGYLKVFNVSTTENVIDFNGNNLSNITVSWNDTTNPDWTEQFGAIINAALVDSQRVGRPGNTKTLMGIKTDEYAVNLVPGYLPVIPFSATVDGINMLFEAVSMTSEGKESLYEPAPRPSGAFNVLYRNDKLGYASNNTGFFVYFKQGVLDNQDFTLTERISNRVVSLGLEGVNDTDTWLYKLNDNGAIESEWSLVDNVYATSAQQKSISKEYYSITSRANDAIDLIFGDGVFGDIPVGTFRAYARSSNGLQYVINPEEMQAIDVPISYISRYGRLETLNLTVGLTTPVSNSRSRETIVDIKTRAPSRYYTQNRMVNGEDYTNFPYTLYGSIVKSSAVNRSSTGTSRYLDLVDVTGKYSSINVFGSDGLIYRNNVLYPSTFTWIDVNDIASAITNIIEPQLSRRPMLQFYYENYDRPDLEILNISWSQSTTQTNLSTGYFKTSTGAPKSIGTYSSDNTKYITQGSLVKFGAPTGYCFDKNNKLKVGSPTAPDDKIYIWATASGITLDGTNFGLGNLTDGSGPVILNNYIPTGSIPLEVVPTFVNDIPTVLESDIADQIELYRNFGIRYDSTTREWALITSTNLATNGTFSLNNAGDTTGTGLDASWLIQCTTDGETYTVLARNLDYYFGSVLETRFFYENNQKIYDSKTGTVVNDFIDVLKTNSQPDNASPLNSTVRLDIIDQPLQSDGYRDDFSVVVSFTDSDGDGVADDPDIFTTIVAPDINVDNKLIFLQLTTDFDNLERYIPINSGIVDTLYATKDDIEASKGEYINGQLFYATTDKTFWELNVSTTAVRTLSARTDFIAYTGRQDLSFQYRHNAPLNRRIDPGTTNIIDLYLLTSSYYNEYINYIRDTTNTVTEPIRPTVEELSTAYSGLDDYKMISDSLIPNSAMFKPLFGSKAPKELQGIIKVIKNSSTTTSDSEIKTQVISVINNFFTIDNWDFGQTFFFSELASYIHSEIGEIVSSVVLVPKDTSKNFGDLYEIKAEPNEILIGAATVSDVEVVDGLTASVLRTYTGDF